MITQEDNFTTTAETTSTDTQIENTFAEVNTKRKLLYYPSGLLRTRCVPVIQFDESLIDLTTDMFAWIRRRNALGIAAPQLGDNRAVVAVKVKDTEVVFVNPSIVNTTEEKTIEVEGCLSFPLFTVKIPRYKTIDIVFQDLTGEYCKLQATDLLAVVLQHECDHLFGTLMIDHMTKLQRDMMIRKYNKVMKKIQRGTNHQEMFNILQQIKGSSE